MKEYENWRFQKTAISFFPGTTPSIIEGNAIDHCETFLLVHHILGFSF